jgi:hypothetical protein
MASESPALHHFKIEDLHCYGCAHSASSEPYPGKPSGERPCCFCLRNPEREKWAKGETTERSTELKDNKGNPRDFNPFAGNLYNGAPALYNPMDNYITLDHQNQEMWFDDNPDYAKPVHFVDGIPTIIEDK